MNEFIVIIPSRLSSTRLKEKALLDLNGKSLIERVYLRAIQSNAKKVFIATDSKKIEDHVKKFSPNVILTSNCLLYTSPSPRDGLLSRMPSSA